MEGRRPVALVTGASSGIGAALARTLAGAGHDRAQFHRVVTRAGAGDVELLVSNAGVSAYDRLDHLTPESVEAAWTLNADATPLLVRAVLPAMLDNNLVRARAARNRMLSCAR